MNKKVCFGLFCFLCGVLSSASIKAETRPPDPLLLEYTKQQLPPIAFIERQKNLRNGTSGTMFAQVRGEGASLWVWNPQSEEEATRIFQTTNGMIYDISPSYDGQKLLMTYRTGRYEPFHIWEINVDGTGLHQLTDGRYHDFNPVYYPDGRIIFSSSRVESYSMCQDFIASALYIMKGDGSDMRRLDWTTLSTNAPSILPDGSILCTRWEYQDKNIFSWQGLWTVKPNGRQLSLYYGNTLTIPNCLWGPKPIPGTDKAIFTMTAHHYRPVGDIAIVDRHLGLENTDSIQQLTFATNYRPTKGNTWRDINWGPGDIFYQYSYTDPWPINENLSLVCYGGESVGASNQFQIMALYHTGMTVPLYAKDNRSFYCPVPLNERPKPMVVGGDPPQETGYGTFYVQNVYDGLLDKGVQPGQVKALRIWQHVPKKYNTEGQRVYDHYPLMGFGTYYSKIIHGTVPVTEDGAAYFKAPSNAEIFFQALDKDGKEIIRMGSVTQITTGEYASCLGCHENRMSAPEPLYADADRLNDPPDEITPPSWGAGPVDYVNLVQPVWDEYCVSCHSGPTPDGDVDLSGDKNRFFSMSFSDLCRKHLIDYYWINTGPTGNFPPLATGSWTSQITQIFESEHQGVNVDAESRRRVYAWIDSNAIYYACWDMSRPYSAGGRDTWSEPGTAKNMAWINTVSEIVQRRNLRDFDRNAIRNTASLGFSNTYAMINMTHPENSRLLSHNLAENAGGTATGGNVRFTSKSDPDYQALLNAIQDGADHLLQLPRMDMEGAVAIPQNRDFGKTW
jgi:hypothetical protein